MSRILQIAVNSVFAVALFTGSGCDSGTPEAKTSGATPAGANQAAIDEALSQCENRFDVGYSQLQPDRLGIIANASSTSARLNEWLVECENDSLRDITLPVAVDSKLTDAFKTRMQAKRFGIRDIEFARDSLLARSIATQILDIESEDRNRIVGAFYYVMQHVELRAEFKTALSPFQILLTGTGTVEDRVWIFSEVMYQLHYDMAVVRSAANKDAWLMGVLLDGDLLLFDPLLGVVVPATDEESALPKIPATLAQAQVDPTVFANLSTNDFKHPLDGADFSAVSIELVANSTRWSSRMEAMQTRMSGVRSAIVYESIADEPGSVVTRVGKAGKSLWSTDDLGFWMYAENQSDRIGRNSEADSRELAILLERFKAPLSYKQFNREGVFQIELERESNGLRKTRVKQLLGNLDPETTADLMRIREQEKPETLFLRDRDGSPVAVPLPEFLKNGNNRAARDALFFIGECQRSNRDLDSSVSTLRNYVRKFPTGERVDAALLLASLGLVDTNRREEAVDTLGKINGPLQRQAVWLRQRWGGNTQRSEDKDIKPVPESSAAKAKKKIAADESVKESTPAKPDALDDDKESGSATAKPKTKEQNPEPKDEPQSKSEAIRKVDPEPAAPVAPAPELPKKSKAD